MNDSMKSRVISFATRDLEKSNWLRDSIKKAKYICKEYSPCKSSYEKFDSEFILNTIYPKLYI